MRPTTVTVTNTEAGRAIAAPGETLEFWEFEARARAAAEGHAGSYLKTWILVTFDTGDTYECRIDLGKGYRMPRGFQDHIAASLSYHESAEGQERLRSSMPPEMAENRRELHAQWLRMDFTKPEPEAFATEPTQAGLQYVMPGCEKRAPDRQGAQGVLF